MFPPAKVGSLSALIVPDAILAAFIPVIPDPPPTNSPDVVTPVIKTSPVELIPTPDENPTTVVSVLPPTWKVKRGSTVATPTFPAL